jgi:tetratricopeptide (TPR) repeat protein
MGFGEIRFFSGKILPIVSVSLLLALSVITWRQVAVWENNLSLFQHALAVTTENQKAHQGLGLAWHVRGRQDLAVQHLQESLRIYNDPVTHNDLGYVYMAMGKYPEAEKHFRAFLSDNRKSAKAHNNLGAALAAQGRYQEAEIELATALQLDPEYAAARQNLAGMRAAMGKQ